MEASIEYREKGDEAPAASLQPLCFRMVPDLREECRNADRQRCVEAINRERDCQKIEEWQQGHSPKEHKDMLDAKKMLQWQEDRRQIDRYWNIGQAVSFGPLVGAHKLGG
jgi:hypothetical protein